MPRRKNKGKQTNENDRQDEEEEGGKERPWYFQHNCWTNSLLVAL